MKSYHSHGKLLLTGEYVVLDGALSLAVPTRFGQDLTITPIDESKLVWKSINEKGEIWFETKFNIEHDEIATSPAPRNDISDRLLQILKAAKQFNPKFLINAQGYEVKTRLEFPKNWGLGTSSTLINNIANWAHVNPYQLLEATFGGSGYDIACAQAKSSLTYQLKTQDDNLIRHIKPVNFNPSFKNHLYFVHLNQKQNSREGIAQYRANALEVSSSISKISTITEDMISCDSLNEFQTLMNEHELLISEIIKLTPVKQRLFNDFKGSIKSLGAWGGDFIMVACNENPTAYFLSKGYHTILSYSEMVKN